MTLEKSLLSHYQKYLYHFHVFSLNFDYYFIALIISDSFFC